MMFCTVLPPNPGSAYFFGAITGAGNSNDGSSWHISDSVSRHAVSPVSGELCCKTRKLLAPFFWRKSPASRIAPQFCRQLCSERHTANVWILDCPLSSNFVRTVSAPEIFWVSQKLEFCNTIGGKTDAHEAQIHR